MKIAVVWEGKTPRDYSSNVQIHCPDELMDKYMNITAFLVNVDTQEVVHKELLEFEGCVSFKEAQSLARDWALKLVSRLPAAAQFVELGKETR